VGRLQLNRRVAAYRILDRPGRIAETRATRAECYGALFGRGGSGATTVARAISGSVKTSRSSRLRVENSETIAPSGPA